MMTKVTLMAAVMLLLVNVMVCEIRFAFSFWRHGARAPDRGVVDGKDILGESWENPGELTPSGMRMHYLLGRRNRERWVRDSDGVSRNFLSPSYSSNEVYVRSTEYNRTMMSVMSNLQGLFPEGSGPTLTPGQSDLAVPPVAITNVKAVKTTLGSAALPNQIQVIPVHLMGSDGDYFFYYNPYKCEPLKNVFAANSQLKAVKDTIDKIKEDWLEDLEKVFGNKGESYYDNFGNMYLIADSFVGAYTDDRVLKKFTDANINLEDFRESAHAFEFQNIFNFYNGDSDRFFSRLVMTPFLKDVFSWMDRRIANDVAKIGYTGYAAPKVVLYSGHDVTLGAAQTVLKAAFPADITDLYATPFASSFIFELYRPDVGDVTKFTAADYTVKVTYNDDVYLSKPYSVFKKTLTDDFLLSSEELYSTCGWNPTSPVNPYLQDLEDDPVPTSYIDATIVLSVLLFLAVIALIVLIVLLCKKNKTAHGYPVETKVVTTV
jgi:hypothetical protein